MSVIRNGSPPFVEFVAITRSAPGTTTMRWPKRPSAEKTAPSERSHHCKP